MEFKDIKEVVYYLDTINDVDNPHYNHCIEHSFVNLEWYREILKKVLEDKPKRVIDVGSNLNQYGFLFANEGIEYIGIDNSTTIPYDGEFMQPVITDKIKYIQADYRKIADQFKNDVIISCLCVGYLVKIEEVKAKRLIINDLDEKGYAIAKEVKLNESI